MNLFEINTVINRTIRISKENWGKIISEKHTVMEKYLDSIKETLYDPEVIRLSKWDGNVYLFYRKLEKYYICVVIRVENSTGFVITTYLTNKIKIGREIWKK